FGVYTPMPTVRARKLCPKLIVVPGNFERYEQFSNWMFGYCYDFTFLTAFVLTVVADLTFAVGAAMLLAAVLLIKRISHTDEELTHALARTDHPWESSAAGSHGLSSFRGLLLRSRGQAGNR